MGQLQGVIEDLHVLAAFHFSGISCLHCCRQLLLPHLHAKRRVRTISHPTGFHSVPVQSCSYRNIFAKDQHHESNIPFSFAAQKGLARGTLSLVRRDLQLTLSLIRIQPAPAVLHHICAGEELNTLPAAIHDTQLTAEPPV